MLKYNKKNNTFANTTKTNSVSLNPVQAWSYGHFKYVEKRHGLILFNKTFYSQTTRKHQCEALNLLRSSGVKVDVVFKGSKDSLQNISTDMILKYLYHDLDRIQNKLLSNRIKSNTRERLHEEASKILKYIRILFNAATKN